MEGLTPWPTAADPRSLTPIPQIAHQLIHRLERSRLRPTDEPLRLDTGHKTSERDWVRRWVGERHIDVGYRTRYQCAGKVVANIAICTNRTRADGAQRRVACGVWRCERAPDAP
jgi:hypothetical protein